MGRGRQRAASSSLPWKEECSERGSMEAELSGGTLKKRGGGRRMREGRREKGAWEDEGGREGIVLMRGGRRKNGRDDATNALTD